MDKQQQRKETANRLAKLDAETHKHTTPVRARCGHLTYRTARQTGDCVGCFLQTEGTHASVARLTKVKP